MGKSNTPTITDQNTPHSPPYKQELGSRFENQVRGVVLEMEKEDIAITSALGNAGPVLERVVDAKAKYEIYMKDHPGAKPTDNDPTRLGLYKAYSNAETALETHLGHALQDPGELDLAKKAADRAVNQQVQMRLDVHEGEKTPKAVQAKPLPNPNPGAPKVNAHPMVHPIPNA